MPETISAYRGNVKPLLFFLDFPTRQALRANDMPRAPGQLHVLNSQDAERAHQRLRRARETYVPSRLNRILKEEGRLALDFDAAQTLDQRLKALDGLIRCRRLIMDMVGWPKPPTMRPGKMPAALETVKHHHPLGDIDVPSVVSAEPIQPPEGG